MGLGPDMHGVVAIVMTLLGWVLGVLTVLWYFFDDHIPYDYRLREDLRMMRAARRLHATRRRTEQAMQSEVEPYRRLP